MKTKVLHITNGDAARKVMENAGFKGDILPWRDVLHEGPTPANLTLQEMSKIRAKFIADSGWEEYETVLISFKIRDDKLVAYHNFDEVILWFEHDLYDQLQLIQILDWFASQQIADNRIKLICVDYYLGLMSPKRMKALYDTRVPVTERQLALAKTALAAFCSPSPRAWVTLLEQDTSALPFMSAAVIRHLEQFPSLENGLNRTERQLLNAVNSGLHAPEQIFEANQVADNICFMGDWSFWIYMQRLFLSNPPLLRLHNNASFVVPTSYPYPKTFREQKVSITDTGVKVLNGARDWLEINGIDKWLGGVHLHGSNIWRWDSKKRLLTKTDS